MYDYNLDVFVTFINRCTLSLGWTSGTHTDLSQTSYTWDMVWDMLELVQELKIGSEILVNFQVSVTDGLMNALV